MTERPACGHYTAIVRTAKSPDPFDKFWGVGQEIGPIGGDKCLICDRPKSEHPQAKKI